MLSYSLRKMHQQFYKEYKNKVKEIYGEEAHNEIINSIMIEKAEEIGVRGSYLGTNCAISLEENDDGMYWIDFNHRKLIMEDGLEVYIIEMPFESTYDFLEY